MSDACTWPEGTCKCWKQTQAKPDPYGRVAMHCEEGLALNKASMARFMTFCLSHNVEIYQVYAFNPRYRNSAVIAAIKIRPDQIKAFEAETGGKLRLPAKLSVNSGADHE